MKRVVVNEREQNQTLDCDLKVRDAWFISRYRFYTLVELKAATPVFPRLYHDCLILCQTRPNFSWKILGTLRTLTTARVFPIGTVCTF